MSIRNVVAAVAAAAITIVVTNQVKAKQAERDLWAEAADSVE